MLGGGSGLPALCGGTVPASMEGSSPVPGAIGASSPGARVGGDVVVPASLEVAPAGCAEGMSVSLEDSGTIIGWGVASVCMVVPDSMRSLKVVLPVQWKGIPRSALAARQSSRRTVLGWFRRRMVVSLASRNWSLGASLPGTNRR